ncbi:MAG: hypothetical protein U0Q12_19440 [Vicinamibacterales bacterium]
MAVAIRGSRALGAFVFLSGLFPVLSTLGQPVSNARSVSEAEAIVEFRLRDRFERYGAGRRQPGAATVVDVVEGDLRVAGNLLVDAAGPRGGATDLRAGDRSATTAPNAVGLIVTGALIVDGAIVNANVNSGPFLLVLGPTRARAMFAGGAELRFEGTATFDDAVVGCYNDGRVSFAGSVEAPMVVSEDHDFAISGARRPPYVDYFNGEGNLDQLLGWLDPELRVTDVSALDAVEHLLPRIRRGQRVLRLLPP